MKKLLLSILFLCSCASIMVAQDNTDQRRYVFKQQFTPVGVDNYLFAIYYYNNETVYTLRSKPVVDISGEIQDLKMNPSGNLSFSVLYEKKDKRIVEIHHGKTSYCFKDVASPTAICYTPDAKLLLIATPEELLFYKARRKYELIDKMPMPFAAKKIVISENGYYLAATDGDKVVVWNLEQKRIRKDLELGVRVNDIAFSSDNSSFAVLTDDGSLSLFNTRNFMCQQSLSALGYAKSCVFHPEGKYISVVSGDARITTVNLYDEKDRSYLDDENGGISKLFYLIDTRQRISLLYNTERTISAQVMGELAPNYTKLLADELDEKMSKWMKMLPGETLEEYNLRVNNETRLEQRMLFKEEIATRLADNKLEMAQVSLGNYNTEKSVLAVDFDNMPSIYLPVPASEINDFNDPSALEFRDTKYGVTEQDNFEMIYADVYNQNNDRSYIFDNRNREELDFLEFEESFVPLELIQQSNMETMKLEEIKEDIVGSAKQDNIISDHTNISVDTEIVQAQDADGNNILNYKIDFEYEVEPEFSAYEDFAPGKYQTEKSGAAMAMLAIVQKAFEQDFSQYVQAGKKLQISIRGMADALPIHGKIAYSGCYGDFDKEPIYKNNTLSNISVSKASGITQNEQLAFLRATGVKEFIRKNLPIIDTMNADYRTYVEISEGEGGAFRRITIEFMFVDAF